MKVLITGAAGFLGSHLAFHHLERGDLVYGVDNMSTALGYDAPHFKRLKSHDSFHFFFDNIHSPSFFEECMKLFSGVELIYNFACPASPPRYQERPIMTMMTCVAGTNNVLMLAEYFKARLVHASTSEVYGDPKVSPQRETYRGCVNSYGPRSCYDEGKRAAEALCFDYKMKFGVDARLVRIFNTYGPHMDPNDGRVVSNFLCQALRGEPLTIYGDGSQSRSFCYVSDLIDGITSLAALPEDPGGPVNVGNPHEFTIAQLATVVNELVGNNCDIVYKPFPVDDPLQRRPDIGLANKLFGFNPKVSLDDGLKLSLPYFRKVLNGR